MANGDSNRQGAPDSNWLGVSNTDDKERTLMVKCPVGTTADAIEALPDQEGVVIVVECNYSE
jgi:hypothetical protein